jgi:hypothetical protein
MPHIHRKTDQDLTGILSGGIDKYTYAAVIYYQAIIDKCELAAGNPYNMLRTEWTFNTTRNN